jgi:CO/xanthine dehydrogenase Mo-binding subunit
MEPRTRLRDDAAREVLYDPATGRLVRGSFQDYCMPRADQFCTFDVENNPTLTEKNPLGVKGVAKPARSPRSRR